VFCDSINESGRAFYDARGLRLQTILKGFYHYCDAALYVRDMETAEDRGIGCSQAEGEVGVRS